MNIEYAAKELMKKRGWTQVALAKAVGIHPVTLCRLLSAPKRRQSAYDKLLDFLVRNEEQPPAAPSTPTEPEEVNHGLA